MAAGLKSPKARLKIDGVMTNVVANFVIPEDAGWAQLKDRYKKVVALWPAPEQRPTALGMGGTGQGQAAAGLRATGRTGATGTQPPRQAQKFSFRAVLYQHLHDLLFTNHLGCHSNPPYF